MKNFLELAKERYSCRKLTDKPIDPEKIDRVDESSAVLKLVSDDGKTAVWAVNGDDEQTVMLREGEEEFKIAKYDESYGTYARFDQSQKLVVITNIFDENLWMKRQGQEPVKAKLGTGSSGYMYTEDGPITENAVSTKDEMFVFGYKNDTVSIYRVSQNGDKERVLSRLSNFEIANGLVAYTDDDKLYLAKIDGGEVKDEERIARDVDSFVLSPSGKYLYYMSDCEGLSAELYCYNIAKGEEERISSEACYAARYGNTSLYLSEDGSAVYFFEEAEDAASEVLAGDLYRWTWGDDSPRKISSEVLLNSLYSANGNGCIDDKSFTYMKNPYHDGENLFADWMYFDGKDSEKMASDIIVE